MHKLCGVNLPKAALIVGTLYVFVFVYATIHASINLANFLAMQTEEEMAKNNIETNNGQWGINSGTECFHIYFVVLSAVSLVCCVFLILGALRHNHCYLLIWLIDGAVILITFILCLIYSFYGLVMCLINSNEHPEPGTHAAIFVALLVIVGLKIYIWLGIQQLYKDIREGIYRRRSLPSTVPLYTQVH